MSPSLSLFCGALSLLLLRLINNAEVPEHEIADENLLIKCAAGIRELDMR
jgi:hypothetical protein